MNWFKKKEAKVTMVEKEKKPIKEEVQQVCPENEENSMEEDCAFVTSISFPEKRALSYDEVQYLKIVEQNRMKRLEMTQRHNVIIRVIDGLTITGVVGSICSLLAAICLNGDTTPNDIQK